MYVDGHGGEKERTMRKMEKELSNLSATGEYASMCFFSLNGLYFYFCFSFSFLFLLLQLLLSSAHTCWLGSLQQVAIRASRETELFAVTFGRKKQRQ